MPLLRSLLALSLMILSVTAVAAQDADVPELKGKEASVTTTDKSLKILRSVYLDAARFSTYGRLPAIEPVDVKDANALLCLDVETDFPAATSWMIAGFYLADPADRDAVAKYIPTIGFTLPKQSGALRFYRTAKGAAAFLGDDNEVLLLENALGRRGQLSILSPDAKLAKWAGGVATVRLLFEVPKNQTTFQLVKVRIIEIPQRTQVVKESGTKPRSEDTPDLDFRTWTSRDGRKVDAAFVGVKDDIVTIRRKTDGKTFSVPIDKLSDKDNSWIKQFQRESATVPSPPEGWPKFSKELAGDNLVRIRNPNKFKVLVGLRLSGNGRDFLVAANGVGTVSVPDGKYAIYFWYSYDPEGIYQGDSFALAGNGVEIQIVEVVDGNYGIRKVK